MRVKKSDLSFSIDFLLIRLSRFRSFRLVFKSSFYSGNACNEITTVSKLFVAARIETSFLFQDTIEELSTQEIADTKAIA